MSEVMYTIRYTYTFELDDTVYLADHSLWVDRLDAMWYASGLLARDIWARLIHGPDVKVHWVSVEEVPAPSVQDALDGVTWAHVFGNRPIWAHNIPNPDAGAIAREHHKLMHPSRGGGQG